MLRALFIAVILSVAVGCPKKVPVDGQKDVIAEPADVNPSDVDASE